MLLKILDKVKVKGSDQKAGVEIVKSALEALTQTLSFQLARDNVTVNAISPGYTKKDGNHSALSQSEWDKIINKIPLSRLASLTILQI